MTRLPSADELNRLTHEELLTLVSLLIAEVQALRAEVDRLKSPPTTSRNSSQPPSRDWKVNRPTKRGKKRGAQPGHLQTERPLVDSPDQTLELKPEVCGHCGQEFDASRSPAHPAPSSD